MKSKLFLNGGFFAALYFNPQLGGLCVAMFRRTDWVNVDVRFVGSVCNALRFLRGYEFHSVSNPSELMPYGFKRNH